MTEQIKTAKATTFLGKVFGFLIKGAGKASRKTLQNTGAFTHEIWDATKMATADLKTGCHECASLTKGETQLMEAEDVENKT